MHFFKYDLKVLPVSRFFIIIYNFVTILFSSNHFFPHTDIPTYTNKILRFLKKN